MASIIDLVLDKRLKAAEAAAAAKAAADAANAPQHAPPPIDPTTATPAQLLAAATGGVAPAPPPAVNAATNPLAGKAAYMRFPSIPQSVLLEVMSHKLVFKDLAKLDVSYSRVSTEPVLSLTDGRVTVQDKVTSKHFSSPTMMLNCLSVYFDILTFHVGATMGFEASWTVSHAWHVTQRRILQFNSTYKWSAVVSFLEEYYYKRLAEMLDGRYSGWWDADVNLESFHLAGQLLGYHSGSSATLTAAPRASKPGTPASVPRTDRKPNREQYCFAFAAGRCTSPCPNGRKHEIAPAAAVDSSRK